MIVCLGATIITNRNFQTGSKASKLKSKRPIENSIHDNLEETFALSLDALKPNERRLYTALTIFTAQAIPEQAILHLWDELAQLDSETSKDLITDLASRALCDVTADNASGVRSVVLHPLLRSFLYSDLDAADRQNLHLALLSAYERLQTGEGWHSVPDDGYFYQYFPFHLKEAGEKDLLRQVLLDYDFIQTTLIATQDIGYLLGDYEILRDPILQLVQHAIQQSELILLDFPEQLAECLYTQLMLLRNSPDIDALLDACYQASNPKLFPIQSPFRVIGGTIQYLPDKETWTWRGGEALTEHELESFKPFQELLPQVLPQMLQDIKEREAELTPPPPDPRPFSYPDGFHMSSHMQIGNIHYTHTADVNSIALSGDFALSPGNITTQNDTGDFVTKAVIQIFNWQTGHFVDFVRTGEVNALAVSGNFAVCASIERAIRVWNWKTNEEIRTLTGYVGDLVRLTLSGEYVAVAIDMSIRIWNWQSGDVICTLTEDEDKFLDVSLIEDEIAMVTANHIIQVWNWRDRDATSYSPEASGDSILSTVLKGEWVFYLLENQSLKIANWRTKELICTIQKFSGQVIDVVAQDKLLTALDNQLYLWNLRTGELITSVYAGDLYAPHESLIDDSIQNAVITPNLERFIVGTQEGRILFLQPNPALLTILRENN